MRPYSVLTLTLLAGCATARSAPSPQCDPGNGDITLPDGFCAGVFADHVGEARHLVVLSNGDVFVSIDGGRTGNGGGILALRDTNHDGRADVQQRFASGGATGITWRDGQLYFSTQTTVLRFPVPLGSLTPTGPADTIVWGIPAGGHHSRTLVLDDSGHLFVNVGSDDNVCLPGGGRHAEQGMSPCPQLVERAGIWRYDATKTRQRHAVAARWASGVRNSVGLAWNDEEKALYGASNGRDVLFQAWPQLYTKEQGAESPSEEFMKLGRGEDYGWPYCYHDHGLGKKLLAPEYGGDHKAVGRCAPPATAQPVIAFPGHWAPMGLQFYTGTMFPARYRGGAFLAFHGSWNRAPMPQEGYRVDFIPFGKSGVTGTYETFADGFAGGRFDPGNARHRPVGLAQGPDGALFITDDQAGRIWRVIYVGAATN